jgi:hypothetical protein
MLRSAGSFVVLLVAVHGVAWACSCLVTDAATAVASGDTIVVATVTDFWSSGCGGGQFLRGTVEVEEVIAGPGSLGPLDVQTNTSGASCGVSLVEGERWAASARDG